MQEFSSVTGLEEQSNQIQKTEVMEHLIKGRNKDIKVDETYMQSMSILCILKDIVIALVTLLPSAGTRITK